MNPLIVALDVNDEVQAIDTCEELSGLVDFFKIGLRLYLAEGNQIIEIIQGLGKKIFLDLKLFDIPNTVKQASAEIAKKGIDMFTVQASGGPEMMKAAVEGVKEANPNRQPVILGVTVLTSFDKTKTASVVDLAVFSRESGLDGVVCSGNEAELVRKAVGQDFLIVTPGIRLPQNQAGDQKRIATPKEALSKGADYLVVGRPIIAAKDRRLAAESFIREVVKDSNSK